MLSVLFTHISPIFQPLLVVLWWFFGGSLVGLWWFFGGTLVVLKATKNNGRKAKKQEEVKNSKRY